MSENKDSVHAECPKHKGHLEIACVMCKIEEKEFNKLEEINGFLEDADMSAISADGFDDAILGVATDFNSESSYEMLEKKYKFGDYDKSTHDVLKGLYKMFPHPRYISFSLNPMYYIRWLRYASFAFKVRYLKKILTSKRKKQYLKALISVFDQTKAR